MNRQPHCCILLIDDLSAINDDFRKIPMPPAAIFELDSACQQEWLVKVTQSIAAGRAGEQVWIAIEDNGSGIAPDDLARTFASCCQFARRRPPHRRFFLTVQTAVPEALFHFSRRYPVRPSHLIKATKDGTEKPMKLLITEDSERDAECWRQARTGGVRNQLEVAA